MHQIVQIRFETCKVFIASEGAHPLRHPFSNKEDLEKCHLLYTNNILHVSINNSRKCWAY